MVLSFGSCGGRSSNHISTATSHIATTGMSPTRSTRKKGESIMSLRSDLRGDIEGLRDQIEVREGEVRKLVRQKDDLKTETGLSEQVITLKKRITELEIEE